MPQHKVKVGETLSAIARRHQVTPAAIQAQNPQITQADHIEVGWILAIPANDRHATTTLPEPQASGGSSSCEPRASGCADEYAEIIHVMGAGDTQWCVALPEAAATELLREIEEIDGLMAEFRQALETPPDSQAEEPGPRRRWMIKAAEKGVIEPDEDPGQEEQPAKASAVQSRIAALNEQIAWYEDYDPGYFFSFISADDEKREAILSAAKEKRLAMLRSDVAALQSSLNEGSASQGVKGTGINAGDFPPRSNTSEAGIVEILVFSRPGRWYYIRKGVYRRILASYASIRYIRKSRNIVSALRNGSGTAGELIGKIREDLAGDAGKSPIGSIEVKFAQAKDEFFLLREEHSKLTWNSSEGESEAENNFQASAEAQLMRFAMQASAGVHSFDLSSGEIDIGTKASASMALAEAEARLAEVFVPNEAGWDCRFTYRNRAGQLSDLAFGAFRLAGDITLNCFVGGRASAGANARLSTGAATFLLSDRKKIEPDPKAGLAVSGNAFAGAEAGGSVGGKFCWVHPDEQFKANANWQELLKIEAGGTFAGGLGAGLDFEIGIQEGQIVILSEGRLVFGPGASGSFGSVVDVKNCWSLCCAIFSLLKAADHTYLENVSSDVFLLWSRSLYLSMVADAGTAAEWINRPVEQLVHAWRSRSSRKSEAETLAKKIKERRFNQVFEGEGRFSILDLPPETIGMVCHTLVQTFIESHEEDQEKALIYMFSHINTWRKFFEVLQHMTETGVKCNAMESLEKICAILDDGGASGHRQLQQFHDWVFNHLAHAPSDSIPETLAWAPSRGRKNWQLIERKLSILADKYGNDYLA